MAARVLDVGNCDPDHFAIRSMLVRHFDVEVDRARVIPEAEAAILRGPYDLVLVNRRTFADGSDGMDLVRFVRNLEGARPAVMLVSNFADAQESAVAAGAEPGFGKAALAAETTIARLAKLLPGRAMAGRA